VVVHGALLTREAWQFVLPQLAERPTVWSHDRRAHGRSGGVDLSLDGDLEGLAAAVAGAGPEVYLAGHSFDALGGLEAAAHLASLRSLVPDEPTAQFHCSEDVFRRGVELVDRDDLEGFLELSMPEVAMVGDDKVALLRAIPEGRWLLVDVPAATKTAARPSPGASTSRWPEAGSRTGTRRWQRPRCALSVC
jgi:hypothetical protein